MTKLGLICSNLFLFVPLAFISSCSNSTTALEKQEVFTIEYGNFEDEINFFDYSQVGNISSGLAMRDGFFYIANSELGKVMELNSYGDLLTLYYNSETNPKPSFATDEGEVLNATRRAISYPFNKISDVVVDSKKQMFVVDCLPADRQEVDEALGEQLTQVVLRFDGDGNFVDYIGQQGPGGTPFPYVKNIYVTNSCELVVVCSTGNGMTVYWFAENGHVLFTVPIEKENVPVPYSDENQEFYMEIDNVVPDYSERKIYIKADFSVPHIDESSHMQSGISFDRTQLYVFNIESVEYEKPLTILPYTEKSVDEFSNVQYDLPYEFLGVTDSGWFFFIISTDDGFELQMVQNNGQVILNRKLTADHRKTIYYKFNLSNSGILSELVADSEKVHVNWWRTDSLIQSIIKK